MLAVVVVVVVNNNYNKKKLFSIDNNNKLHNVITDNIQYSLILPNSRVSHYTYGAFPLHGTARYGTVWLT